MLRDEFNRLMNLLAQGAEGKQINLEEVFKQSLAFFDLLNVQLKNGTSEEKQEALMMMSEMYNQMKQETKKICEKTGLSEDQLMTYAENPSNFSPEQWRAIQDARGKMSAAGQSLSKSVGDLSKDPKKEAAKPSIPQERLERKPGPHPKKVKKSNWMRS